MFLVDSGGNCDQGISCIEAGQLVWKMFGNFADGRGVWFELKILFSDDASTRICAEFVKD